MGEAPAVDFVRNAAYGPCEGQEWKSCRHQSRYQILGSVRIRRLSRFRGGLCEPFVEPGRISEALRSIRDEGRDPSEADVVARLPWTGISSIIREVRLVG